MKRRTPKPQTKGLSATQRRTANHCHTIVKVVGKAGRRKNKTAYYNRTLRSLDKKQQQIDQFYKTDVPQYEYWMHNRFRVLFEEIHLIAEKIESDELLTTAVNDLARGASISKSLAYDQVMERWDNLVSENAAGKERARERDARNATSQQTSEEELKKLQRSNPNAAAHIKELYRELARLLHPDTQKEMSLQKLKLWHQTQAAYQEGDAEQLEIILASCKTYDNGTPSQIDDAQLERNWSKLREQMREANSQIAALRKEPAWNFSQHTNHEELAISIQLKLTKQAESLRKKWQQTQKQISEWKAQAEHGHPNNWIQRSLTLHESQRTQEAYDKLLPARDMFPESWAIPYNLAGYSAQLGRLKEAEKWLKLALALDEKNVKRVAMDDPDLKPLRESMGSILGAKVVTAR